ncbi:MAG: penicillin-binding protein 2 [Actinobacteria bacterium]|nr:penicillin-binding protein 2 [Actinomycetota bacterium]MBU1944486.1 penicillin-binding protein 2 [Actinomycetota bacterium]MBU2688651.1 penicillin-binding protein 2 [Actinomycetota bacterium]
MRKARFDRRLSIAMMILFCCLGLVAARLVWLQVIKADRYSKLAAEQRDTVIDIAPRRGTVTDREGEILAISEDVTTVYATPYLVKSKSSTAGKIASVIGEDPAAVLEKLEADSGFVYIARKLDRVLAEKLKKMDLPGIGYLEESKRFYPMGPLCAQLMGMVDVDNKGQVGLELYYEELLGGTRGEITLERDAAGNPIPGSEHLKQQSADGVDLQLTLDKDIQACLMENLDAAVKRYSATAGTAIVMDCNTGDVLAMGSVPTFDPNTRNILDPASMRNRAVTDVYEPGSALKIVTAAGALEQGVVKPDTVIQVPSELQVADQRFKDAEEHPARTMTFSQVISQSSNIGTIQTALQMGPERMERYLERFGLGHLTGIDFPGEVAGIVPPTSEWTGTSAATIAIGQGISITPVQLACVAGTVANGGRKVCPHFLKAKIGDDGVKDMGLGGLGEEVLDEGTCEVLTPILEQVLGPEGTGTRAAVNYYRVAGKTGTAEKPRQGAAGYTGTYMATFVGFAPVDRPRLVCMVVLDEPSPIWGGHTAAPTFKPIMEFSLQHLKIAPSWAVPAPAAPPTPQGGGGHD